MNITSNIVEHIPTLKAYASRCQHLVEIGVEFGTGSTYAFNEGMFSSSLAYRWASVDIKDRMTWKPAFPRWKFIQGDSREVSTLNSVSEFFQGKKADLIFIDTVHTKEYIVKELEVWSRMANDYATWLFHDTWMNGFYNTMTDGIKEFAVQNPGWVYKDLSKSCHGLGALIPV